MARFYGKVGYSSQGELVGGVWSDGITERAYFGDVVNETRTDGSSDKVNDDIRLSERINIVADAFAFANFADIKYVERMGVLWSVTSVEVQHPRLILSLGGVYHGPTTTASNNP